MIRFLLLLLLLPALSIAQSQDELLPVEQAFVLKATLAEPGKVSLHWQIAKDYYLYKQRIKLKTDQAGLTLAPIELPAGIAKHDEFFGDVEIYHDAVEATLAYTLADASARSIRFTVTVQGCHEVEPLVCYPPHPRTITLDLPSALAATPALGLPAAGGPAFNLGGPSALSSAGIDQPALPAEQAFRFEAIAASPTSVLARWTMPKGYYLYRDKTVLRVGDAADIDLGEPTWPAGVDHVDEHFGNVVVYFDQVELPVPLRRANGAAQSLQLDAEFQGCKENGICYPVMARSVTLDLPAATPEQLAAAAAAFVPIKARVMETANAVTSAADNALRTQAPVASTLGLAGALLAALLGGLVLNLMPCVLPVLSFKLLGLAQSGESTAKARSHALWYSAGVLASFAAIGLLVIGLRGAGQALGWGFQLQQPLFVAVLVYLMFAIGLSLSGLFQIGAGFAGVGQGLASKSGPAGDFFTGVLACVVASPCTAPFMGGALAYAFAASPWVALLVFLMLGLGLALPFLLIGFVPALARLLPKPGAWMDTFKQVLAFPMYLTAVWLVWVLGQQRGVDAIGMVLVGVVMLALALWWLGRGRERGVAGHALTVILLALSLLPVWQISQLSAPAAVAASDSEPYSREKLDALRAEGRTVFVNMTADWCTTCKLNERTVLGGDAFRDQLKQANAVYMKGDWTNVDPAITAFLEQHHAVGVPLYVVFKGKDAPGQVLPTLLTDAIVDAALTP